MIVWRVEDRDGYGPWAGRAAIKDVWKYMDSSKTYNGLRRGDNPERSPDRMPAPHEDPIVVDKGFRRNFWGSNMPWRHAYPSLGTTFKWWGDALEAADQAGLKLVAYEVDDPQIHENQVIFDPAKAKQVMYSTFSRAHRAFMHGTEEELYASD